MDTRTPDDLIDEQLRAAGARVRATAPSPEATDAALNELRGHPGALRRVWWVFPAGVVAAAAATIGVLVLAGNNNDSAQEEPAVTPPVTAAPTVPATTPPTSAAPTTSPVFAGDPPLTASAAALGCRGTLGDLGVALSSSATPVTRLACSGDDAQALRGDQLISLHQFDDDGVWQEVGRESSEACPERCLLAIPPEALLARDLGDLSPVDVTRFVRRQSDLVEVSDLEQYGRALGARLAAGQDPAPTVTAEPVDGADVLLITLSGLGDDSASEVTYVVWYDSSGPAVTVDRAFLISRCSRGVAVDEAGAPMDLCI
jgi:hypothetical protein